MWKVMPLFGSGPFWNGDFFGQHCEDQWYYNLMFINNLYPNFQKPNTDHCMVVAWYLSNDMQFFILLPIFLLAYKHNKQLGYGITLSAVIIPCTIAMIT
eukprot:UN10505